MRGEDYDHETGRRLFLGEKFAFNKLAAEISAKFVNLPANEVDREISEGLRQIGELCEVDRCILLEVKKYGKEDRVIYEHHMYIKEGLEDRYHTSPGDILDTEPGFREYLATGKPLVCRSIEDMPANWPNQIKYLKYVGISSVVIVPLIVAGELIGAIGVDSRENGRTWPDDLIKWLRFVVEIFSNALARKRAEEKLARSENELRLMADALPVLIAYASADQCYRFTNVAYSKWYGLGSEQILGKTLAEVLGDDVYFAIKSYIEQALAGNTVRYEMERIRRDGAIRSLEAAYVPHVDPSGGVQGIYCLLQDVTDRKENEREAQKQRNELARVARAVTMGELAVSLAHELNQPLAAILTNAQAAARFLNMEAPRLEKVREALADIVSDTQRAGKVVCRARTLLKKGEVDRKSLSINQVIQEVVALVSNDALLRDMTIKVDLAEGLPPILGDPVQMQQVLLNLILNAFDAMKDVEKTRKIVIRTLLHDAQSVAITVRDFGVGIQKKDLTKIFDAFFTTKQEGMGMGLSISRSIVEAHGGRMWATSNSGKGATFSIALPVSH